MIPGQLWGDSARYLEGIQSPAPITVEQPAAREVDPIVPGPAEQIYTIFEGHLGDPATGDLPRDLGDVHPLTNRQVRE